MILVSVVTFKGNYVKPRLGSASKGAGSGPRRSHSISAAAPIIAALSVQSSGAGMTRCAALPRRVRAASRRRRLRATPPPSTMGGAGGPPPPPPPPRGGGEGLPLRPPPRGAGALHAAGAASVLAR